MIISSFPIWMTDVFGSLLMIIISIMCLNLTWELRRRDKENVIWAYLLWVCYGLSCFAVSRSAGHLVKQVLLYMDYGHLWKTIQPFSGAVNTLMFMVVASITLFFERTWRIYQGILKDRQALRAAHGELLYLNQNLENLAAEQTRELAASEHNYRRIFEVSRDMIVVTRTDGSILAMNPTGYGMLGYEPADDSLPENFFKNFFLTESDWFSIIKTIKDKGFILNAETTLKHRDNRGIRTLVSGSLDKGFGDHEETIHFLVKDIEQRKQIEEQIAQADKLASIGQLSAGIAHEINNPLGIILGYSQLLIRHEDPGTERFKDLKTIEKHVRNCKSIVEDLLNFARTSPPREDSIRIEEVMDEVLKFVRQHSDTDHIEVVRNYDPAMPHMLLDGKKIKQVLMNLIMNARHAIGRQGTLTLSTEYQPAEHRMLIKISDTGYGIEKKNLTRVFDPFFTTKPTGEGTGLGLSVSYGIIKNHGGDIRVESEIGKGSTFTVILPEMVTAKGLRDARIDSDRR